MLRDSLTIHIKSAVIFTLKKKKRLIVKVQENCFSVKTHDHENRSLAVQLNSTCQNVFNVFPKSFWRLP